MFPGRVLNILLIEDDDAHAAIISRHVSKAKGVRLNLSHERLLADGLARLTSMSMDALLLDLRLPDSDLQDTLARTLAVAPHLPVIVLSSMEDLGLALEAVHQGAQDYLCKSRLSEELLVRALLNAIERKQTEAALTKAKEDAERANCTKDRFLAALSHELRTPLTPALMICSSLEENQSLDPEIRSSLQMLRRSVELEVTLIDDLLDFTQATRGRLKLFREVLDLHTIITEVTELFVVSEARNRNLEFGCHLQASEHHAFGDRARIQQVFWNLFKNALKFTPSGGCIAVHTQNPQAGRISIEVVDTGIGIDQNVKSSLFQPFQQGNIGPHFGGLGLGLVISRSIVEAHGGDISASSAGRDLGATFCVGLETCPPQPDIGGQQRTELKDRGLRILLIEDDAATRDTLVRLLTRQGHAVIQAGNLATARAMADTGTFDLVLSDLGLPDGDGRDLMPYLKSHYGLHGIAFSGYGTDEDIARSMEAGFDEHLVKPIEWARLRWMIGHVIGKQ